MGTAKINILDNEDLQLIFEEREFISIEELIEKIEEINFEKNEIEKEYENYKDYVRDNYRQISNFEQSGMSERDFY